MPKIQSPIIISSIWLATDFKKKKTIARLYLKKQTTLLPINNKTNETTIFLAEQKNSFLQKTQ